MAIDPNTGIDPNAPAIGPANAGAPPKQSATPTADGVNKLVSSDSPYMTQAKAAGLDVANTRGLLNTSIAAGASQKAAYDAATPIAAADANIGAQKELQAGQIASTEKIATAGNLTSESIAKLNATTSQTIAQMNIDASAKQQAAEILNQQTIATQQAKTQTDLAKIQQDTQEAIAGMNIADADKQQLLALAQQKYAIDSQSATQLQVASMNVAADQQDKAMAAANSYATVYAGMVNVINNNPNIPADARQSYLDNAKTLFNNGMGLVEQTYNVQLDWGQFSAPADNVATPAATASPTAAPPVGGYDQNGNYDGSGPYDANGNLVGAQ